MTKKQRMINQIVYNIVTGARYLYFMILYDNKCSVKSQQSKFYNSMEKN